MGRQIWNFISRSALVAAFLLAFAAVIFNTNLLSFLDGLNPIAHAEASPFQPFGVVLSSTGGLTLLFTIVVLVVISFFGPPKRKVDR